MWTELLASTTGIHEPSLRLLLGLLGSYPAAWVQQTLILKGGSTSPKLRAWIDVCLGAWIGYYFCGKDLMYPLMSIVGTYGICYVTLVMKYKRTLASSLVFFLNFSFLLLAYMYFSSNTYDINWTTPQSVLCLRLISFAMDFADGEKPPASSSSSSSTTKTSSNVDLWSQDLSLPELPPFLYYLAYTLFPSTFLVGPQFPFHLYHQYLHLTLFPTPFNFKELKSLAQTYAFRCLGLGLLYLGVSQVLSMYFSTPWMLEPWYLSLPFWQRWIYGWMTGKLVLTKYLGVWLLSEGSSVASWIAYHGRHHRFTALANVHVHAYETATSLTQIIGSFNVNTNAWAKRYIFKRCLPVHSKQVASFVTLLFLALWHGFHPAYFFVFFLEYIDLQAETLLKHACPSWLRQLTSLHALVCWTCTTAALYYAAVLFDLLTWHKMILVLNSLYWWCHVAVIVILILGALFPYLHRMKSKPTEAQLLNEANLKLKKN
ncbi:Lysophosphatidylcholine acyltransferase 3 [Coelomomyces lativittatus]|nr:Lysophosphatidylcholine acyltransferase 3 [Coelomomyces lativittatus]KAJ1503166.1 Lysophosphatidylcholine acyltransferase 3 [Coelomomyces lativittatus]KAJ1506358.1 Lysophosphatidylcholine acyltransferase 3 [Coelomomyces lativittatus]